MTMKPLERLAIWVKPEHIRAHSFDQDAKANWRDTLVKLVAESTAPGSPGLNVPLEDEKTALEILYDNPDLGAGIQDLLRFASDTMLEAGANPLAFGGGAILAAGRQQTNTAISAIAFLGRRENDTPLRDKQGGNLEHVLAEHEPQTLLFLRSQDQLKQWNTSWRNMQRDSDGATPAHLIWRADGLISEFNASSPTQAMSLLFVFWNVLEDDHGVVDIMIPDHAGVTVAQLMHDAIYTHNLPIPEGRKNLVAKMEYALLHTNTRQARGVALKAGRL